MVRINIHISPLFYPLQPSSIPAHHRSRSIFLYSLYFTLFGILPSSAFHTPTRHALHHCRLRHHGTTSSCSSPTELLPLTLRSHHQRSCIDNPDTSPPNPHLHHHNHRSQRHRHPNHCHRREHRDHHHRPYRPRTRRHFNRRCYPII